MRKNIIAVALILAFAGILRAEEMKTTEAVGYGASVEEAKKEALKAAVQEVVGVFISAQTLIKNANLVYDKVYSKAEGFCKVEKWSEPKKVEGGLVSITCKVAVKEAEIRNALSDILSAVGNPTVMVVAEPNSYWQTMTPKKMAEVQGIANGIKEALIKQGFQVINAAFAAKAVLKDAELSEKNLVMDKLLQHALSFKADYILVYDGAVTEIGPKTVPEVFYASCRINAKAYNAITGTIQGNEDATADGLDKTRIQENANDAAMRAAGKAVVGEAGANKLLDRISENFKTQAKSGIPYIVTFQGGNNFQMKRKLVKIFEKCAEDGLIVDKGTPKTDGPDTQYEFFSHEIDVTELGMEILDRLIKLGEFTYPKDYPGISEQRGQKIVIDVKPLVAKDAKEEKTK